jgi:hypothetical protein
MPSSFKEAVVGLDNEVLKNLCPVSNLSFIFKIMKKVVQARIEQHLVLKNLQDTY